MPATKTIVIALLVICAAMKGAAQTEDCESTLGRAVEEFNAGHFYIIPSVLSPCLNQFSREQSQRAYLLLTQTYLLLDDPIGAKQSYLNVLKANPEFLPDTALHQIDVIYLSKRFTASSIFSWFGKAGANISIPRVIHNLSPFTEDGVSERYLLKAGYQFAAGGDLYLTEEINLRGELGYTMAAFGHETRDYFQQDIKTVQERQSWVSVPVTAVYSDVLGKYRPYGYVGYSFQYLLRNRAEITLTNDRPILSSETGEREQAPEASPTLPSEYRRNRFNQSIVVGGGMKVKLGLDFIFVDLRYNIGMRNVVSGNLYGNYNQDPGSGGFVTSSETSFRFAHVDDFFRLDNLSISVGFLRPLYKPRELKRARTRSVMKQMRK